MTRTGQAAADYALSRVGDYYPPPGYCLKFTREVFEIGSYYASAIDAWNGAQDKHPGDRFPPLAVPVFFQSPSVYDHIATHVGGGQIVTTFNDEIRQMSLADMEYSYGPYLGWSGDLNGVTVYTGTSDTGEDWLSYLSYDEQRRVLQAADSWNYMGSTIKTNTDRLPAMHATIDVINAGVANVTNGVLELLDALHAVQGRHARSDRFSWAGLAAVLIVFLVGLAWAVGFVVSIVNPESLTPATGTALHVIGGALVGAVATWIVTRRGGSVPHSHRHRMKEPDELPQVPPYVPPARDVSQDVRMSLREHPQDEPAGRPE